MPGALHCLREDQLPLLRHLRRLRRLAIDRAPVIVFEHVQRALAILRSIKIFAACMVASPLTRFTAMPEKFVSP
jgi:hypothetical protein